MSSDTSETKPVRGIIAEYETPEALLQACRRIRDAGFTRTDAFTPFPMHEVDEALGIKPTLLPWICFGGGATGATIGLLMTIWMNGFDYTYLISNKPYVSLPAFIPVIFELTILLASFGAFFGMLALNGLPKFSNPVFTSPRFDRATDDRFFLMVDARDDRFTVDGVTDLLGDTGAAFVENVVEDDSPAAIPKGFLTTFTLIAIVGLVPPLIILRMRVTKNDDPRFHIFYDMDFTPAKDAQRSTTLFADGRTMRPPVPGTVMRGTLAEDPDFMTGVDLEALASLDPQRADRLVALQQDTPQADAGEDEAAADAEEPVDPAAAQAEDDTPWLEQIPVTVDRAFIERGQEQFGIYCSVCHGLDGRGRGLVAQRAQAISATYWIQPSSLHQDYLYEMPVGKIFNTITHGIRKMPGYGRQIAPRDRWAVVAYVRALQRSGNAELDDVPKAKRAPLIRELEKPLPQPEAAAEPEQEEAAAAATSEPAASETPTDAQPSAAGAEPSEPAGESTETASPPAEEPETAAEPSQQSEGDTTSASDGQSDATAEESADESTAEASSAATQ